MKDVKHEMKNRSQRWCQESGIQIVSRYMNA